MPALYPAEQGAFDYLCSIYAIINARRWLDGTADDPDSIFAQPVLDLYRRLIVTAADMVPATDLLTRGIDPGHVAQLIAVSGLRYRTILNVNELERKMLDGHILDGHMQGAGACAIIHFTYQYETRRPDHYSLLIRHNGSEALLDSYQFALQDRDGWLLSFTPDTGLPQGARIRDCWLMGVGS